MLVLARKVGESIMIGDEIEISVLDVRGEQVRIGIKAPDRINILRREIYDEIRCVNQDAKLSRDAADRLSEIMQLASKKDRDESAR
ncbi:carbon storage regulator CsrA [Effusibacillus pohliae]|uniref:carbon storage regulator CsrA n=1 Tax=Effusibacillus pohliae TaxID=232270 RepID=UPI000372ED89|nr:carbon storage regulator CsrA [Effusibacillus pohliae]